MKYLIHMLGVILPTTVSMYKCSGTLSASETLFYNYEFEILSILLYIVFSYSFFSN